MITREQVCAEKGLCQALAEQCARKIKSCPKGTLYYKTQRGRKRLYLFQKGREIYVSQEKHLLAKRVAERNRAEKALTQLRKNLELLTLLETLYVPPDQLELPEMQTSITGGCAASRLKISRWLGEPIVSNPYKPEKRVHRTAGGVMVRSKSELLIGMFLEMKQIPYKYEDQLILGGRPLYPDFTVMRPSDGKLLLWEHFGMMQDREYRSQWAYKMLQYYEYGFQLGDNLIATYDRESDGSIDMALLERVAALLLR